MYSEIYQITFREVEKSLPPGGRWHAAGFPEVSLRALGGLAAGFPEVSLRALGGLALA